VWIILTIIFALSYTQSPLFTSNQNQYFLHGLAKSGWGYLYQDWLVNTIDPTPIFSLIVGLSYQLTHFPPIYYFYYALLLGVYLYSLAGIISMTFDVRNTRTAYFLFIASLILVHSAALRFLFSQTLGINWTYILEDGVADQRLLGSVFQPSTFGVLLMLSIYLFLRKREYAAILSATLAASIHPTYLLSAGVLTFTYMLLTYNKERKLRKPLLLGALALLTIAPILSYVYLNFANTPPETARQAQTILVNFRIPHHARIDWWFDATVIVKIVIVGYALFLVRQHRKLFTIMAALTIIAVSLTLLQILLQSNTLALIFPWRISTILVPLSTALILGYWITWGAVRFSNRMMRYQKLLIITGAAIITLTVFVGTIRLYLDFTRKQSSPERPMMTYVSEHAISGETYLTPIKMQDFRLATSAPVYIDFKSIPYRDSDVLEWYRRVQLAKRFYKQGNCQALEEIASENSITHIVIESGASGARCLPQKPIYSDENYQIYEINNP